MSFSGIVNGNIFQEDELAKLVDYEALVKLNSELKTNPFLGHITIIEARGGYVFFDNGNRNCSVEQLITAIKNKQGYITNISLLRGSIEAYNNSLKKKAEKLKLKSEIECRKVQMQERQKMIPYDLAGFSNFKNKLKSLVAKTKLVFSEDLFKRLVKFNSEVIDKVEDNFDYFCKLVAIEYFGGVATSLLWDRFNSIIEEKFQQRGIGTKEGISEDCYDISVEKAYNKGQTNYWIIINEWFDLTSNMEGQFTFEGYIESDGKTVDSISITIEPRRGFSKEYDSLLVSIFNSIKTPLNDYDNFTFTTSSVKDIMEFIKKIKEA